MTFKESINIQIEKNSSNNLLYSNLENEIIIDEDFKKQIIRLKSRNDKDIKVIIDYTVNKSLKKFYNINQFLQISSQDRKKLENIYYETWKNIKSDCSNIDEELVNHHKKLSKWIISFYPDDFVKVFKDEVKIGSIVNEEYSSEFQFDILKIKIEELIEPVIDIGCGMNGNLVKKIAQYRNIIGIDRMINRSCDLLQEKNWFEFKFRKNYWGTIIANMSFSNHLLYTYVNKDKNFYNYLIKYNEIINSLKINGEFIYAPSLSFIEERLEKNRFSIKINKIKDDLSVTRVKRLKN